HDDQQRQHHEHGHDAVLGAPPGRRLPQVDRGLLRGCGHQAPLERRVERATTPRAMTLMMMVRANSSTPSPISAARNSPEASPNWFAMTAGMESPAANRWDVITGDDPMTSATAIVSPMARPRPSREAPTMPP